MARSTGILTLSLFAVAILSGCAAATAASTSSPTPAPSATVALAGGQTEEYWVEHQQPLGIIASDAQTRFPDDFAYSYFADEGLRLVIGFAAVAPAEIAAALESTGLPFTIVESVGYNSTEQDALFASVYDQVLPPPGGNIFADIRIDPEGDPFVIELGVTAEDPADVKWVREHAAGVQLPAGYSLQLDARVGEAVAGQPGG